MPRVSSKLLQNRFRFALEELGLPVAKDYAEKNAFALGFAYGGVRIEKHLAGGGSADIGPRLKPSEMLDALSIVEELGREARKSSPHAEGLRKNPPRRTRRARKNPSRVAQSGSRTPVATAKRGDLGVAIVRHSYSGVHGSAGGENKGFIPTVVQSVDRNGIVKSGRPRYGAIVNSKTRDIVSWLVLARDEIPGPVGVDELVLRLDDEYSNLAALQRDVELHSTDVTWRIDPRTGKRVAVRGDVIGRRR